MKTKVLLLFSFMACSFVTSGFKIASQDYIDYFHKINVAESLISGSDYEKALSIYNELFLTYPSCFYKDLHNACVCALKLEKYKEASSFASALVTQGYELKDFESPAFDGLRKNEKYWKSFVRNYPKLRSRYEKSLNIPLRNKYLILYEVDQQTASALHGTRMQDSMFYELAISLSGLIKEYGFPLWLQNKDTINPKFYDMLRHYCGLKNRIMNDEELQQDSLYARMDKNDIPLLAEQALHRGLILPDNYKDIVTYWDPGNPYGTLAIMIDFKTEKVFPFLQAATEEIPEINNRRNNIGLPPVTGELSDSLLYSTWYKYYPFQMIREAFLSCKTCNSMDDFWDIKSPLEKKIRTEFLQKKDMSFILREWTEIRDFHYTGIRPIVDSKLLKE